MGECPIVNFFLILRSAYPLTKKNKNVFKSKVQKPQPSILRIGCWVIRYH
jgi:hypothetical protein